MGTSLFKRGNVWWCWVRDETGKLVRKSTKQTDKLAASLTRRDFERRYADPSHHAAHSTTVEKAIADFLKAKGRTRVAAGTLSMYRQKAGHLARVFGPKTNVAAITAPRVDHYVGTREDEGASKHTVHKELVTLRQVLKHAKRSGAFPGDIAAVLPVGYSPSYEPRKTFLTRDQVTRLLDELEPFRRGHVAYVVATGARRAEAARARRSDMAGEFVRLSGSKTDAAKRSIPVVFEFYRALVAQVLHWAPGKDLLFSPWGNARRDILRACERAGVPAVTWNDLRRTFASLLKHEGVSNDTLADLLGHAGTAMVRKVYGQDTPTTLANAVRAQMGERLSVSQSTQVKPETPVKGGRKHR